MALRKVGIREEHYKTLAEYEELSGVSIEESIDEALEDFFECCGSSRIEELADKAGRA